MIKEDRAPRILIIDDEGIWREKLEEGLSKNKERYEFYNATNYLEALNMFSGDTSFALVCMNVELRGATIETYDWLHQCEELMAKAKEKGTKIMIMTGLAKVERDNLKKKAKKYGVKKEEVFSKKNKKILDTLSEKVRIFLNNKNMEFKTID